MRFLVLNTNKYQISRAAQCKQGNVINTKPPFFLNLNYLNMVDIDVVVLSA